MRDWTLAETATMLFLESDYDFAPGAAAPVVLGTISVPGGNA